MTNSAFTSVINVIRAQSLLQERLASELASVHGVALNEAMLLMYLERASLHKLTRIELAKRLHLNASSVTRMAAPMEKTGLVERQSDPRDARMAYVVLTKAGRRVAAEVRTTLERNSADFFRDRWTGSEIATLASLLNRLIANEPGELA